MAQASSILESSREDSQFLNSASFVDAMEAAQARGDVEIVELNLPTLKRLLIDLADRKKELDALKQRARAIQRRHHNSDSTVRGRIGRGKYVPRTEP